MTICPSLLQGAGALGRCIRTTRISARPIHTLTRLTLLILLATHLPVQASLPPGWSDTDIGSPTEAGSASYTNGTWTVAGGGIGVSGATDQLNFASTTYNCDGSVIAQVTKVQNTEPGKGYSAAGVMLRNDNTPGGTMAWTIATASQGVEFIVRTTAGATVSASQVSGVTLPVWVQVMRSSDLFSGYYSTDGSNWIQVGSTATITMNGPALAGLAVTAANNAALNTSTFSNVSLSPATFGVYRELWTNLNTSVNSLTVLTNTTENPTWPNNPVASFTHVFTNFETEINSGMNYYGQRLRAFVIPPTNGLYTFWIASDDTSALFLSTNENPANQQMIAQQTSWNDSEDWTEYPDQQSAQIYLQGGCRYFLRALMQQGNGGDNLSVAWQLPDGVFEGPMEAVSAAGTLLVPYTGLAAMPGIFAQTTNPTVVESFNVSFSVLVTNQSAVGYQWFEETNAIAGATLPVYTLSNASMATNNGQVFTCVVTNNLGAVTSAPIALTVLLDTNPPTVLKVFNVGLTNVELVFSKPIAAAGAANALNYVFTNGLPIEGATLAVDNVTVTLSAQLVFGSNYTLVINNIYDLASVPNEITANTEVNFTVRPYVSLDLGPTLTSSTVTYTSNGLIVTSWGDNIGGISDDCNFQYQLQNGNFDVAVCLTSLGLSDLWAGAGLMARASLVSSSPFAAALATPGMVGEFFSARAGTGSKAVSTGSFPVNYPNTWLRLNRVGNTFTGFGSYDGTNWTLLGSVSISMPSQIYLGLTVDSNSTNGPTTAQFLDFTNTSVSAVVATPVNPHEPLGPSTRKTGIVISEIMYKPAPRADGNNVEFLELYNSCPFFQDISRYQVTCADMSYQFPSNTIIPGNAFFVLAASPESIGNVYGVTSNVFGPYTGSLKKSETLQLLDEQSNVLLTVPYTDVYPWPVAADGTGHSIVLANASYGEGDPRAWDISDQVGGTPGGLDTFHPSPLRSVVINEILPHSENPAVPQFIELYNHSANSVDVSGCILTDDPTTNKYVIPPGTVLGPAAFVSLTRFGFPLKGAGATLYFIEPDGLRVLDAVQYEAQADGVSYGRWPDGARDFYAFTTNTPGTNNSTILIGDVVINELMYDPFSGNDDDQYIELYNKGSNTMDLSGWQFTAGVTFTFPTNTLLAPNGYLVVSRNVTNLLAKYPNLSGANTVGNFTGKLSHDGKRVALAMPQSYYGTNTIFVVEDEVTYGVGGRWGEWSGGGGSSLELIDPHSNHRLAANWADSDETQKSSWVDIENTGVLDNGANFESAILHAQIGLLDAGECLVDNIEVDYNGNNLVQNGTFENGLGLTDWSLQGDMVRSSLENSGYQSSYSLHIRCSDKIWTGDNSCQVSLSPNNPLSSGKTVTLRYKARWLHGWNEPLLRLNGNWLDATAPLPVPPNLGTPGAPNSQYTPNAGPAMYNVTHSPSVPAANQPVVVTAQVHDPDGLQSLTLYYRLDPATTYKAVPMSDAGTGGDAIAHDGIFSGTIPGQAANQIVAFYLSATDTLGAATRFPSLRTNDNEPIRECVVMFGDGNPVGSFGVYHLWITQTNVTRWANLGNLSNEGNDCTFVNGNRVIYNMQGRFAGSPYHQDFDLPNGSLCHYDWDFNKDDMFLGATSFDKIHQPGNGPGDDPSLQREECANTFLRALGVPWLYKRYVAVYVNGNRRGGTLMEDTQVPNSDLVKECFPNDTTGYLYKMQPWFEFAPTLSGYDMNNNNQSWCNIMPYTTTGGVKKPARYRYSFEVRRTADSFNDFTNVFSIVDAADSYGKAGYVANLEEMANMENWMRVFAANHAAGNWDSFGAENAQNLYGYIGTQGTKYSLLMWDYNIVLGNSGSWGPGQSLLVCNAYGQDQNMQNIYNTPTFLRMYWRAMQELVNGPLTVANSGPLLDAKYHAFVENGLTVENPDAAAAQGGGYPGIKAWLTQAKNSIASQVAGVNASSFSVSTSVSIKNNVASLTGQAPLNVATIWVNGVEYPITWATVTGFDITVPLTNGANALSIVGVSRTGQPVAGASNELVVSYTGTIPPPAGHVVINEIMWNPVTSGAAFVELYNNSTNATYDLSGWQLQGLSYTFPAGSLLPPLSFLVLAGNIPAFAAAYGATNAVFDTFSGTLAPGQILSLQQPSGTNYQVVAQVKFDDVLPWPTNANTPGVSLQLIDAHQDNWRVGNWSTSTARLATPDATNSVAASLPAFAPLWLNEVEPDNLAGLTNSAGAHAPWLELYNPSSNTVPLEGLYLACSYTNLSDWPFPSNATIQAGQFLVIFADGQTNLSTLRELHTSFALSPISGSVALSRLYEGEPQVLDYVDYTNLPPDWSYGSLPDGQSFVRLAFYSPTPGASNALTGSPPASFIAYDAAGSVYTQNFDTLPDPGATSVSTANPVTINGVTYSLGNPFDFAAPVSATGKTGGLGLDSLSGWFGLADSTASVGTRFGATDGDQTTGGQISFGLPSSSNRALGLLATSTTGYTAFGARFLNTSGATLNTLSVQAIGEIWRQSDKPKTLECYYYIDPTAAAAMSTAQTASLPGLNVSFATVASDTGGVAVDGTNPTNQISLAITNQVITNWPAGAALWLVWEMNDATGKAQGLAIDNFTFSAAVQGASSNTVSLNIQGSSANQFVLSWPSGANAYQLYTATNLASPVSWSLVTNGPAVGLGQNSVTLTATNTAQFFRLVAP